jgi:DNA-binding CsgD family transcriptional regulator
MKNADTVFNLTPRENEVAALAAAGASYKKIAAALNIGTRTVEDHLTRLRKKIGATSAYDTVAILSKYRVRRNPASKNPA